MFTMDERLIHHQVHKSVSHHLYILNIAHTLSPVSTHLEHVTELSVDGAAPLQECVTDAVGLIKSLQQTKQTNCSLLAERKWINDCVLH